MKESTVFEAHSSYVLGLLFTRNSRTLVSAGMDNIVKLWSVPDWKRNDPDIWVCFESLKQPNSGRSVSLFGESIPDLKENRSRGD
jgi:WD40 repeat protein